MSSKRRRLADDLAVVKGCTKTALATILQRLHARGSLIAEDDIGSGSHRQTRRRLEAPLGDLRKLQTPYGPLLKQLHIGTKKASTIDVVNPMAYLFHRAAISDEFGHLLFEASSGGNRTLRILLYLDAVAPGNPLRPEKSRTTDCLYWTILEFPDRVLKSEHGWMVHSTVRTTVVESLPGQHSGWMKMAVRQFFEPPPGQPNFRHGVLIDYRGRSCLIKCILGGFLADEKALKEIFSLKGASGSKPCPVCRNVVQFVEADVLAGSGFVGTDEVDMQRLDYQTSDDIYAMVDRLRVSKRDDAKTKHDLREQAYGVSYDEDAMLYDDGLRSMVRPIEMYIRDPMHILVSGGVAGTHTARLIRAIVNEGIDRQLLRSYVDGFRVPRAAQKVTGVSIEYGDQCDAPMCVHRRTHSKPK